MTGRLYDMPDDALRAEIKRLDAIPNRDREETRRMRRLFTIAHHRQLWSFKT